MKKTLIILSTIALAGCMKKHGPDDSMVLEGSELRLPPEYTLQAPNKVKTIKTTPDSVNVKSQKLLLQGTIKNQDDKNVNSWLIKNAGGDARVKNIKQVLEDDIAKEQSED